MRVPGFTSEAMLEAPAGSYSYRSSHSMRFTAITPAQYGDCPGATCESTDGSQKCCCRPGEACVSKYTSCYCSGGAEVEAARVGFLRA
jgi:hypothetical protein